MKQIQLSTDCKSQKSDYKTPVKTFLSVANKVYTQQKSSLKKNSLSKYISRPQILSDGKDAVKQIDLSKLVISNVSSPSANIAQEVEMPKPLVSKTSNKKNKNSDLLTNVSVFKMPGSTTNREKVSMFKQAGNRKSAGDVVSHVKKIKISKTYISSLGLKNWDLSSVYQ